MKHFDVTRRWCKKFSTSDSFPLIMSNMWFHEVIWYSIYVICWSYGKATNGNISYAWLQVVFISLHWHKTKNDFSEILIKIIIIIIIINTLLYSAPCPETSRRFTIRIKNLKNMFMIIYVPVYNYKCRKLHSITWM